MKLAIVLPALNEEGHVQQVLGTLPRALPGFEQIEIIVIDDGSTDATSALARSNGAHVIRHEWNRGVGAVFQSAIREALERDVDILVGMDADGQFAAEDIPALIAPIIAKQADMVMGNRFASGMPTHMPRLKYWGNQAVATVINHVTAHNFVDVSCGFRAYSREALFRLNTFGEFTYTHESILSLVLQGHRVVEHPVQIKYFPDRRSRVASSVLRYGLRTGMIILRVMLDYRPIRVFGLIAAICLLIGAALEVSLFGRYALTGTFSPYKNAGFVGLGFIIFGMLVLIIALVADMLNRLRLYQDRLLYEVKKMRYAK